MGASLLDGYRAIEAVSRAMLAAARNQDWDEFARCEGACAVLIEQLRTRSETERLPDDERAEKNLVMHRILRNDAEIRTLAEPWLKDIDWCIDPSALGNLEGESPPPGDRLDHGKGQKPRV